MSKSELLELLQTERLHVRALERKHAELDQERARLERENKLLRQKIDALSRAMFGRKSEQLSQEQLELVFAELGLTPPERNSKTITVTRRVATEKPGRKKLPEHLPTELVVIEPPEVREAPESWRQIGEERTEELDYEPARFLRRIFVRPKYVRCGDNVRFAIGSLPDRLVDKGLPAAGLMAQVVISKYDDHLPLYRQSRIYRERHGIELSVPLLCQWVWRAANWLEPIYERMRMDLVSGNYLQVDETPIRYLDPDIRGKCGQGYLWAYGRPGGDVIFDWNEGRSREGPGRMLETFTGHLQCDGYSAYVSLAKARTGLTLVGCWAHARRKFFEAQAEGIGALWYLERLGGLYGIEEQLRMEKASADRRRHVRRERALPILLEIRARLEEVNYLPSSLMGKAVGYALRQWQQLIVYVDHGHLEIDNNLIENAIRPSAVGRKNWLFVGHPTAGKRSAIIYSLLGSCRRAGVEPFAYFKDVLSRLPSAMMAEIPSLTPRNWAEASS